MDGSSIRAKKWDGVTDSSVTTGVPEQLRIEEGHTYYLYLRVRTNAEADGDVFRPMVCHAGETDAAFSPCDAHVCTQTFGQIVYGGSVDVVSGRLSVTHGAIDSYAGETIGRPWISDRDAYAEDAVPTTGAQVVYPLRTPAVVSLAAAEIPALEGENRVWADTGAVSVSYSAQPGLYIEKKLALLGAET